MLTQNDEERNLYELRKKSELDYRSGLNYARDEGFTQGKSQGVSQGLIQGLTQGSIKEIQRWQRVLKQPITPTEQLLELPFEQLEQLNEQLAQQLEQRLSRPA